MSVNLSNVGTSPPDNLDTAQRLVARKTTNNNIKLAEFNVHIQYCATVFDKLIYNINIPFDHYFTFDYLDNCCTDCYETIGMNGYKGLIKDIKLS